MTYHNETTKNHHYPLLDPLCNGTDTLIRKNYTNMLYTIMLGFFVFHLFLCEKFGSESAHTLSISLHFFSFWSLSKFLSSLLSTN